MYRQADGEWRRWRTPAGIACCRCRRAGSKATASCAAITAWYSTPTAAAPSCRRRRPINPSACVRAYPVVERHRFVWLWMGDPALADPAHGPDMHWNDDPAWAGDGKTIHVKCDYRLVVDNLMDLTHETFVHGGSIGNRRRRRSAVRCHPYRQDRDRDPLDAATSIRRRSGPAVGKSRAWSTAGRSSTFEAPCTVTIDVGVAPAGTGAPEGDRSQGVNGYVLNTITPETETTCHYFWAFCRNYRLSDQRLTTDIREGCRGHFPARTK